MSWIRFKICEWLVPQLIPVLDQLNKQNLKGYFEEQAKHNQVQQATMCELQDWMRSLSQDRATGQKHHDEGMEKISDLILAVKGLHVRTQE